MTSKVLIKKFYIKNFWGGNCPPCPPAMYGHDARDNLEASKFKELSTDCFQKIHSMLEAGSLNLRVKMKWPTSRQCKRSVVTTFPQTLCEQDGIDRYG